MGNEMIRSWSRGYIIEHWTRVLSIAALTVTGFYIHTPFVAGGSDSSIMATMRFLHFVFAYALVLGLVVRVYMAFRSTFDADWRDFNVIKDIEGIPGIVLYYLFVKKSHPEYRRYNPLQALGYLFTGLMIVCAAFTGAALYHGSVFGIIPAPGSFRWVASVLGGEPATRIVHILLMWYFIIFVGVHIYMALSNSLINRDRSFTSIFTGFKLKKP